MSPAPHSTSGLALCNSKCNAIHLHLRRVQLRTRKGAPTVVTRVVLQKDNTEDNFTFKRPSGFGAGVASMLRLRRELSVQARASVPKGKLAKPRSKERDHCR